MARMCPASGGRAQAQCPSHQGKWTTLGKNVRQGVKGREVPRPQRTAKGADSVQGAPAHTYWQESEAGGGAPPAGDQRAPKKQPSTKGSVRKGHGASADLSAPEQHPPAGLLTDTGACRLTVSTAPQPHTILTVFLQNNDWHLKKYQYTET